LHCYWTCPASCNREDEAVASTQHLVQAASSKSADQPCLWLRGILLQDSIVVPREAMPASTTNMNFINPEQFGVTSGLYFGDASGGEHTRYPDIRRVGCAFVKMGIAEEVLVGAHFPLKGDVQTVSCGELSALVELVRHAQPLSIIVFVTDNKGVYDKVKAGPKAA
jgi:hypothetical protein